jgi:hypothetical protein
MSVRSFVIKVRGEYVDLTNKTHYRDDSCITYVNDTKQAIKVLHSFQKYRRGANIKMPPPVIIGEAIDYAIRQLRKEK